MLFTRPPTPNAGRALGSARSGQGRSNAPSAGVLSNTLVCRIEMLSGAICRLSAAFQTVELRRKYWASTGLQLAICQEAGKIICVGFMYRPPLTRQDGHCTRKGGPAICHEINTVSVPLGHIFINTSALKAAATSRVVHDQKTQGCDHACTLLAIGSIATIDSAEPASYIGQSLRHQSLSHAAIGMSGVLHQTLGK